MALVSSVLPNGFGASKQLISRWWESATLKILGKKLENLGKIRKKKLLKILATLNQQMVLLVVWLFYKIPNLTNLEN